MEIVEKKIKRKKKPTDQESAQGAVREDKRAVTRRTVPIEDVKPFFLIWREGKRLPRYKWGTLEEATKEAERLCDIYPDDNFTVLIAIKAMKKIKGGFKVLDLLKKR